MPYIYVHVNCEIISARYEKDMNIQTAVGNGIYLNIISKAISSFEAKLEQAQSQHQRKRKKPTEQIQEQLTAAKSDIREMMSKPHLIPQDNLLLVQEILTSSLKKLKWSDLLTDDVIHEASNIENPLIVSERCKLLHEQV